jgi:hypothetical protein
MSVPILATAPDVWDCIVFIAVAETQGAEAATQRLHMLRAGYTRQSVEKALRRIAAWVGEPVLRRHADNRRYLLTTRGQQFLDDARVVVAAYEVMRRPDTAARPVAQPTLVCLPHHTTVVAHAEAALTSTGSDTTGITGLTVTYLHDPDSIDRALAGLDAGTVQILVGPRPEPARGHRESVPLYRARLEVMLPADYPHAALPLTELLRGYRMLAAPPDAPCRRLLDGAATACAITRPDITVPGPAARIVGETYDMAANILRATVSPDGGGHTVVVASSDANLPFKPGNPMGWHHGHHSRFRWLPIWDDRGPLTLEVYATIARRDRTRLQPVLTALAEAAAELDLDGALPGQPAKPASQPGPHTTPVPSEVSVETADIDAAHALNDLLPRTL